MGTKKKDLEIVYNLQWKNKPENGGDKANIIGMYDIPATTLKWEVFKSYLLKNSGTAGDDVKVSYITSNDRVFPIESQTDFQIALYAFRRKARMGEIITLKLEQEQICDHTPTMRKCARYSNDVETQIDSNEPMSMASNMNCAGDAPPEWFLSFMSQYKKDIVDEVLASVSSIVSNIKPHTVSQPSCYHSRKAKVDCSKRRKLPPLVGGEPSNEKDLLKSLRLEFKLENKLEKLERKTKKIKEKKLALLTKSSDSDAEGHSSSRGRSHHHYHVAAAAANIEDDLHMDARPINQQTAVPHMLGGEIYLHQWEVVNSGQSPWSSKTTLHFTWGSKALQPLDAVISCPYLKPGEKGTIAVRLQVPNDPGKYECYWHFHHKGRRFGCWLGCQLIVDAFDLKGHSSVLEMSDCTSTPKKFKAAAGDELYVFDKIVPYHGLTVPMPEEPHHYAFNIEAAQHDEIKLEQSFGDAKNVLDDISSRVDALKIQQQQDCCSDSDNQSTISATDSNSSKSSREEFVVIPTPECFKLDKTVEEAAQVVGTTLMAAVATTSAAASDNFDDNNNTDQNSSPKLKPDDLPSDESQKSDMVMVTLPSSSEQEEQGFAYVMVDGVQVPVPKKYLKSEYWQQPTEVMQVSSQASGDALTPTAVLQADLKSASRASSAASSVEIVTTEQVVAEESGPAQVVLDLYPDLSHCSAAGSCFSDVNPAMDKSPRLFIFPQNCPGFEVVQPVATAEEAAKEDYNWVPPATTSPNLAFARYDAYGPLDEPLPTAPSQPQPQNSANTKNPFSPNSQHHVPNYQQTPPAMRLPSAEYCANQENQQDGFMHSGRQEVMGRHENPQHVHILPEGLVTGAVNVASSAIHTARSVINMIKPNSHPGNWVNGHWVSSNAETPREANLRALAEMGFWDRDLNASLLARYKDDLNRVVSELVQ